MSTSNMSQEYDLFITTPEGVKHLQQIEWRVEEAIVYLRKKFFNFVVIVQLLRNIIDVSNRLDAIKEWKRRHSFFKAFFEILNHPQVVEAFTKNKWHAQLFLREVANRIECFKSCEDNTSGKVFYDKNLALMTSTRDFVDRIAIPIPSSTDASV